MALCYYLPDSRDAVDWTYGFDDDSRLPDRMTRDDLYCHEILPDPYAGMLISYSTIVNGRYSGAARRRLYREQLRRFFRAPATMRFMGDCGAFSYFKEHVPPYSVHAVASFYSDVGVDYGIAVDHIVPGYDVEPDAEMTRRYTLTLEIAAAFYTASKGRTYEPVGVVQGWSPETYAEAASKLQAIGYRYLALGGLVRLKTTQMLDVLRAVDSVRRSTTRLHLLGVTRPGNVSTYLDHGVASIDSTSPLRRAWMDKRSNFLLRGTWYAALRIPSSDSPKVSKRIAAGEVNGEQLRRLERQALDSVAAYARGNQVVEATLCALLDYNALHSPGDDRSNDYARTLRARPWQQCKCPVCAKLGHHVILFRGAERNRSRGFHNIGQFHAGLQAEHAAAEANAA